MNDMQNCHIQNHILTMPIKLRKELSKDDIKFNKRSDYINIIAQNRYSYFTLK